MPHAVGTNLGGIRTLDDIYGRCVIDKDTGCWHLRTARGRPMPAGKTLRLWSFDHGYAMSARRLTFILANPQRKLPAKWVVFDSCECHDCVNPEHLKAAPKLQHFARLAREGRCTSARKSAANRIAGAKRSRVSPDVWRWVMESHQSNQDIAHALGVAHTHVSQKRAKHLASFGISGGVGA